MIVVERKPIPIYEVECPECKSRIEYKKSDVYTCHITCPVCGVSIWANAIKPINREEEETSVPIYPYRKEHSTEMFANDEKEITGVKMGEKNYFT